MLDHVTSEMASAGKLSLDATKAVFIKMDKKVKAKVEKCFGKGT